MAKILVVDDEKDFNEILEDLMRVAGHDPVCVYNGEEAVEKVRDEDPPFDLVLMDLMMPRIDGFEAIREIRKILKDIFIPIIIVSALPEAENIEKGLNESGADEYLIKPFERRALLARVKSMLRLKAKFDEVRRLNILLDNLFIKTNVESLVSLPKPLKIAEETLTGMLNDGEKMNS
jgi:DNA-binding response OmpR family regulator